MRIDRSEVEKVAKLARLALEPREIDALTGQMDAVLGYVEKLNELDTTGIMPTAHAVPLENTFRPDVVAASLSVEAALQSAPEHRDGCFRVPKVIE